MGNQQLIRILSDIAVTDISSRDLSFHEGVLQAKAIFQRHNYQLYQVECPFKDNPFGLTPQMPISLRVIRSLNDDASYEILAAMQDTVATLPQHINLIRYFIMAIIPENHDEKQKAGLLGLPGLYKSVAGTTDYKNDTIQFMLVEEDHLSNLSAEFFQDNRITNLTNLRSKFTLKQFMERVLPNPLLIEFFSSDETLLYQLIIQSLSALAFLNKQNIIHQEFMPQNVIVQLENRNRTHTNNFQPLHTQADLTKKFTIKVAEFLKIKSLSDIAFQKSLIQQGLAQIEFEISQESSRKRPQILQKKLADFLQQIKENKNLYSQYDPPEKIQTDSIEIRLKRGRKQNEADSVDDYDFRITNPKFDNPNYDIYSLGIIILEVYLSLHVHKRDCREMVHNLYLNRLSYQSRCILLNQILKNKAHPIICALLKEMLRDNQGQRSESHDNSIIFFDEKTIYDELINGGQVNQELSRPTAEMLLSRNRIVHFLAFVSDNVIEDCYLPQDINLLQVFISNEMFVPMLIHCGMQNVLNKNKAVICMLSVMTIYLKNQSEHQAMLLEDFLPEEELKRKKFEMAIQTDWNENTLSPVQKLIIESLIESKALNELVELLVYCLSSDLNLLAQFFKINLNEGEDYDVQAQVLEARYEQALMKPDFLEQKSACLQVLLQIIKSPKFDNLFSLLQDLQNTGLVSLIVLLSQFLRQQEWLRQKDLSKVGQQQITHPLTHLSFEFMETIALLAIESGHTDTPIAVLDKTGFFEQLIQTIFQINDVNTFMNSTYNSNRMASIDETKNTQKTEQLVTIQNNQQLSSMQSMKNLNLQQQSKMSDRASKGIQPSGRRQSEKGGYLAGILQSNTGFSYRQIKQNKILSPNNKKRPQEQIKILSPHQIKFQERLFEFLKVIAPLLSDESIKLLIFVIDSQPDSIVDINKLLTILKLIIHQSSRPLSENLKLDMLEILARKFRHIYLGLQGYQNTSQNLSIVTDQQEKSYVNKNTFTKQKSSEATLRTSRSQKNIKDQINESTTGKGEIRDSSRAGDQKTVEAQSTRKKQQDLQNQNQINEISQIILSLLSDEPLKSINFAIQLCIKHQICLSSPKFFQYITNSTEEYILEQYKEEEQQSSPETRLAFTKGNQPVNNFQNQSLFQSSQGGRPPIMGQSGVFSPVNKRKNDGLKNSSKNFQNQFTARPNAQDSANQKAFSSVSKVRTSLPPGTILGEIQGSKRQERKESDLKRRRSSTQHELTNEKSIGRVATLQDDGDNQSMFTTIAAPVHDQKELLQNLKFKNRLNQLLAPFFLCCESCNKQKICLVCAIKFHQSHENLKPLRLMHRGSLKCQTAVVIEYIKQGDTQLLELADYTDSSLLWNFQLDIFTSLKVYNSIKFQMSNMTLQNPAITSQKAIGQTKPKGFITKSQIGGTLHSQKSQQKLYQKSTKTNEKSTKTIQDKTLSQSKKKESNVLCNSFLTFDLYDKQRVKLEHDSHYLTIASSETSQNAMISSAPLEILDPVQLRCVDLFQPKQAWDCFKQSYFEVKIHSGGFYDQVQIGLVFVHDKDISSQHKDVFQTFKNLTLIPGYEPLTIGYHGDDGKLFSNLCQDISIEHLLVKAQNEPERLLDEAENQNSSLFNINQSQVYAGAYGPTFSSGDQIGCGIVPLNGSLFNQGGVNNINHSQQVAVFFSWNGKLLPGIKFQLQGMKVFPVISCKGKLCHIELIQDLRDYSFNLTAFSLPFFQNENQEEAFQQIYKMNQKSAELQSNLENFLLNDEKFIQVLKQATQVSYLKAKKTQLQKSFSRIQREKAQAQLNSSRRSKSAKRDLAAVDNQSKSSFRYNSRTRQEGSLSQRDFKDQISERSYSRAQLEKPYQAQDLLLAVFGSKLSIEHLLGYLESKLDKK